MARSDRLCGGVFRKSRVAGMATVSSCNICAPRSHPVLAFGCHHPYSLRSPASRLAGAPRVRHILCWCVAVFPLLLGGCAAFPDIRHKPTFHNPFPQLHRVAILPFFNLSAEPTVDTRLVTLAYYQELQKIPGFEVVPPGVVERFLEARQIELSGQTDFQELARQLNVDVVIRGAVTEFSPYYPPRMGISVDWIAANPSFHPIPPGYGLPWGTPAEEFIPDELVFEAEFALAREQLQTQTPPLPQEVASQVRHASGGSGSHSGHSPDAGGTDEVAEGADGKLPESVQPFDIYGQSFLPPDWPDPRGFIPPPPQPERPQPRPQGRPIITHTRLYDGASLELTERLARYYDFQDDARFGGWEGYLQRSEDFIRFCCYLHITETLGARGGAGKSQVLWRWPIGRYVP